ncbi:MAG: hypothetical protein PF487_07255 [Bacteroidales bacterium]|jgi:hypothetical protein|nr:hypothetical protein [Bacteroidales bacterium]
MVQIETILYLCDGDQTINFSDDDELNSLEFNMECKDLIDKSKVKLSLDVDEAKEVINQLNFWIDRVQKQAKTNED